MIEVGDRVRGAEPWSDEANVVPELVEERNSRVIVSDDALDGT